MFLETVVFGTKLLLCLMNGTLWTRLARHYPPYLTGKCMLEAAS